MVEAPGVRYQAAALVVDLDDGSGVARFDLLVDELVGDAVGMAIDLDVVVDVDPAGFPGLVP